VLVLLAAVLAGLGTLAAQNRAWLKDWILERGPAR
jgi:hypothetical protein